MKLLIAVDMEGITGVVNWDQVTPGSTEWQRFRRLMTEDVNAAIVGALEGGVDEILVADGHWNSDNLVIDQLHPRAVLNYGSPSPFSMIQGVDQGVDAVFFIGYHAMVGTAQAILDHTWSNAKVANLWLNERLVGETGLNAAVCGHFGVPVILLSGDQAVAAEAKDWLPGIHCVVVKQAAGRYSAACLHPTETKKMITNAAHQAVLDFKAGQAAQPLRVVEPVSLRVEFKTTDMADRAMMAPGVVRVDGRSLRFSSDSMPQAYLTFRALVGLAG
ncbi:MAG: peptidase M55 [Chloroflexi bacterium HGW-Chloroflexi-10]|nr:MAG: peptidase M55 [Chloroflexi bacterium HGW-Chloroflexi-10]